MAKFFKKSILSYAEIVAALLCLVLAIFGPISKGFAAHSFAVSAIILAIIALIASLFAFFFDFSWAPVVASVLVAATFAILFYYSLPIFADKMNDLNFQEGDYGACLAYVVMGGIATVASIVACFDPKK